MPDDYPQLTSHTKTFTAKHVRYPFPQPAASFRSNHLCRNRSGTRLLKRLGYMPLVIVTNKLTSYSVTHGEILAAVEHRRSKHFQQPGRELAPADPTARPGNETVHIARARATIPVRIQRHLTAFPARATPTLGARMAYRDGRPFRDLTGGHREQGCVLKREQPQRRASPWAPNRLRHYFFEST